MTRSNLVTVVMPAYNGAQYITQAIKSVIAQTHSAWELIVIDDGSTDNTAQRVTAFQDTRIRYIYQENRGQAAALNRGLELSHGKYITTLDTDDWYTPKSLADRVHFLGQHPEFGAVYGDGYYCDVAGRVLLRFSEHRIGNVYGDVYDILISTPFFGTGANVMVRREVFETHSIRYDESIVWCQDYDIYIRIAEKAAFGLIETATLWYRMHDTNMSTVMPMGRRLDSFIRTKLKVLASPRFPEVIPPLKFKFFFQLLTVDLQGRIEDQATIFENHHFQTLPEHQQSRLLRLVANDYLLVGSNIDIARTWLRKAGSLNPFDPKTLLAIVLGHLHPSVTRSLVRWWRLNTQQKKYPSPFEMVKGA